MICQRVLKYAFTAQKVRIMTGVQPTGDLTLGNYIGSIVNLKNLQKKYSDSKIFFSVVDLHSLTTAFQVDHAEVKYQGKIGKNTIQIAKTIIASGIQVSDNTVFFAQSQVKQHSELCWILGCIGPQHWLNMMIQYKEKSNTNSSLGIYSYPVLMAADILLYRAHYVPVGQDQKQHLQLTKRYAQRFNLIAKKQYFPLPQCVMSDTPRVMSLTDPTKKMSKSDANDRSRINLSDKKDQIANKIRRAVTDSNGNQITYDPQNRKGLANLLKIYSSLKHQTIEDTIQQIKGLSISQFKQKLTDKISLDIAEIQYNMNNISNEQIKNTLKQGATKAKQCASKTVYDVKKILKLYQ